MIRIGSKHTADHITEINMTAQDSKHRWNRQRPDKMREYRIKYASSADDTALKSRDPWTEAEMRRVLAQDIPDRKLAVELQRTVRAIQLKRHKLKNSN